MASNKVPAKQRAEFEKAFKMFDKNGDGQISAEEVVGILQALGKTPSPDDVRSMMAQVDTDKSGYIDFDEFCQMMINNLGGDPEGELRAAFDHFDADHDGFITGAELKKQMESLGETLTDQEIKHMIEDADLNSDGKIDFQEFCRMMRKQ
eukprot:TRINITY_DN4098_c0_g1_i12.p2 TRINITY_DN4098_c0_g1~~TRINITY_DN4098_c0_g1_i12.p2  ORF type:complete len:150 (+),score=49.43 TRINITY_DN4098_c0_g1_i12:461-910(+)